MLLNVMFLDGFGALPHWNVHVPDVGGGWARYAQVPQSTRPAEHRQQVQT